MNLAIRGTLIQMCFEIHGNIFVVHFGTEVRSSRKAAASVVGFIRKVSIGLVACLFLKVVI